MSKGVPCPSCGKEWFTSVGVMSCDCSKPAIKYDQDKLRFDLLPVVPLKELARVYTVGAKKYAPRNWEKGFDYSRLYAAAQRHMTAFWGGEDMDDDSGCHHLASAAFCMLGIIEMQARNTGNDDRPYKVEEVDGKSNS